LVGAVDTDLVITLTVILEFLKYHFTHYQRYSSLQFNTIRLIELGWLLVHEAEDLRFLACRWKNRLLDLRRLGMLWLGILAVEAGGSEVDVRVVDMVGAPTNVVQGVEMKDDRILIGHL
jgi:hypothetical protein